MEPRPTTTKTATTSNTHDTPTPPPTDTDCTPVPNEPLTRNGAKPTAVGPHAIDTAATAADDLHRRIMNALDVAVRPPGVRPLQRPPTEQEHDAAIQYLTDILADVLLTIIQHHRSMDRTQEAVHRSAANVGALIAQVHDLFGRTKVLEEKVDSLLLEVSELTR